VNLSSFLSIGASGLAAAAHGQNVTAQNIANAATEGYTRRVTNLETVPLADGGGVRANGSTRVQDQYLERRGLGARASDGEASARVQTLSVLDSTFSEDAGSVGAALDAFDSAISDFSSNANLPANRQAVMSKAEDLSRAFSTASNELSEAHTYANTRILDSVRQVNTRLDQIGELSTEIVAARVHGNESGDLEDRRDQLIREVGTHIPVNVIPAKDGAITLQLGGTRTLVGEDSSVHHLIASTEPTSGEVRIYRSTVGQIEDLTDLLTTGSIGGTIQARDGALATARTQLDQLASDVATSYNTQHALGFGLDGIGGRNLFAVPPAGVTGAASGFAVSADVAGQPNFLAGAADAATLPSDNRNALALLHLRDQNTALGGTATAQQSYRTLVSDAGTAAQSASNRATQASAVLAQVDNLRASTSGVNSDEEMISLMKFQRAYQASLRVIETADSMLEELMNMRR
jgi:flagellar hook-associated protein 1 FlgK